MARGDERAEAQLARSRRGTIGGMENDGVRRIVAQYVDRHLGKFMSDFSTLKIKIEVLLGERGDKTKRAVLRSDMSSLFEVDALESVEVTTTPTAAQYNALRSDVEKMNARLAAMAEKLNKT